MLAMIEPEPIQNVIHRTWGKQIRRARAAKDMTQAELAAAVNLEQSAISRIELGKLDPSDAVKIRLALALDRNLEELFAWPEGILQLAAYNTKASA